MKQFCFALTACLVSLTTFGQNLVADGVDYSMGVDAYEQPSMTTVEDILERYGSFKGAVLNMTRDEHIVTRASDSWDKEKARQILKERKNQWRIDQADEIEDRKQARMQQTNFADVLYAAQPAPRTCSSVPGLKSGCPALVCQQFIGYCDCMSLHVSL